MLPHLTRINRTSNKHPSKINRASLERQSSINRKSIEHQTKIENLRSCIRQKSKIALGRNLENRKSKYSIPILPSTISPRSDSSSKFLQPRSLEVLSSGNREAKSICTPPENGTRNEASTCLEARGLGGLCSQSGTRPCWQEDLGQTPSGHPHKIR